MKITFAWILIISSLACFHIKIASAAPVTPHVPNIAWMETQYESPAQFTITWNMWWGTNGNQWRLIENGKEVYKANL